MAKRSILDHALRLVLIGLLAWTIPGAGHFALREKKRGIIIFLTITITFLTGLYIGSIGVIDRVGAWAWYLPQSITSPAVMLLADITKAKGYVSYGKPHDIGQIYTTVAGMLNLLCIISAVYMAHCGRGEIIGSEENDK